MLNTTQTFYDNSVFKYRTTKSQVTIDVFDTVAKEDIKNVSCNSYYFFYPEQIYDGKKYDKQFATLEQNEFLLDGNLTLLNNEIGNEQIGWWSPISDEKGGWGTNPTITIELTNLHSTAGITCFYDSFSLPLKSKCYWFNDELLLDTMELESSNYTQVFLNPVNNYNKIVIELLEAHPNAFVKMSTIDYGVTKTFTGEDLESIKVKEEVSLISNTLSPNKLEFNIFNYDDEYGVFDTENLFKYFKQGQKCYANASVLNRQTNEYEWISMGQFYIDTTAINNGLLKISAYGVLNILNSQTFYSPFYTSETVANIVADILYGFDYYVHPNVKDIVLSGYIPTGTKKDALKVLATACNAVVKEGRDGIIYIFSPTEELSTNQIITENTIYESYGIAPLLTANESVLPSIVKAKPYILTATRKELLSEIKTSLIGFYEQIDVTYKSYTLKDTEEQIYNGTVITNEKGYALIEHNGAYEVTSDSGQTFKHYVDCSLLIGDPSTAYSVTLTGKKYETEENTTSAYSSDNEGAYDDSKLSMSLSSSNELIANQETALRCAKWYLEQMQKRKDVSFDWWAVATAEASDFIKFETKDNGIVEMEIDAIEYNLLDLTAKVEGVCK